VNPASPDSELAGFVQPTSLAALTSGAAFGPSGAFAAVASTANTNS